MVGKLVSFSSFIVSVASYGFWHVRRVYSSFVHGKEVSSGCDGWPCVHGYCFTWHLILELSAYK